MTPPQVVAALAAAGLTMTAIAALAKYTLTNYPPNPLTLEAALNLHRIGPEIDFVVAELNGHLNSAYRSPEVNAKVKGSPTSQHMRGLAADVELGKLWTKERAAKRVLELAAQKRLAPLKQIINEPTWLHVGWRAAGDMPGPPQLLIKNPDGSFSPWAV